MVGSSQRYPTIGTRQQQAIVLETVRSSSQSFGQARVLAKAGVPAAVFKETGRWKSGAYPSRGAPRAPSLLPSWRDRRYAIRMILGDYHPVTAFLKLFVIALFGTEQRLPLSQAETGSPQIMIVGS